MCFMWFNLFKNKKITRVSCFGNKKSLALAIRNNWDTCNFKGIDVV